MQKSTLAPTAGGSNPITRSHLFTSSHRHYGGPVVSTTLRSISILVAGIFMQVYLILFIRKAHINTTKYGCACPSAAYCTYAPRHLGEKCLFICFFCWCATKEHKDTSVKRQTQWSRCCCWKSFARMSRCSPTTLLDECLDDESPLNPVR